LLKNIEQLLKQPIPRVTLAGFEAGHETEAAPRHTVARGNGSSRERSNGRRAEHKPGNGSRRAAPRTSSTPRTNGQHRAPVASYNSDFDFDKPYEPADDAAAAPSPKQRPDVRWARKSQTAALLGGVSDKAG
jgi:hypothetical protein